MTEQAQQLEQEQIEALSQMALGLTPPGQGEVVSLGGESWPLGFIGIEAEHELLALMVRTLRETGAANFAEALLAALPKLLDAAAIILADATYRGGTAAEQGTWLRSRRGPVGVTTNDLLAFVMGQAAVQELGQSLGKVLTPAGLVGALAGLGLSFPGMPQVPTSSTGPAEATATPPGA